ncbi:hypothetical protein NBT05_14995 [Aquimarina sp. ERC-38]|uniref:hypothetical protein n=1 Tax=Aquimarina sp. ERC-38 TaxID=2949996 RepID=UPI002246B9FD|nr:hypothetical protein [Aquimarina sp. ERC-38]UZO80248.1 hypothetical protein NBT05_14995 [Aquimarina sp. ERC-38]
MKKLILRLFLFTVYILILGEIVIRFFHLTSDIPNRQMQGTIQKYFPNQQGYWKGGGHQWKVNSKGWVGELPENYDNLITIVGDSFIENLMNPDYCHQGVYLKKYFEDYNFFEAGRSGVSLIEAMEITKNLEEEYKPKLQLLYLGESDFKESIADISRKPNITQVDLKEQILLPSKLKAPIFKKILYNWKFIYYMYMRFPLKLPKFKTKKNATLSLVKKEGKIMYLKEYKELIDYLSRHYRLKDIIFILRPEINKEIVKLMKNYSIKTILLNNHKEVWTFSHDRHWTCYGHEQVAKQVSNYLKNSINIVLPN